MRLLMITLLAVLTGCAGTKALQQDVIFVKEKQHSMKTLLLELSKKLDTMDAEFNELLEAADAQATAQEKGLTDFYARIRNDLTDMNHAFSLTLDKSVQHTTEKAKADTAQLRKQHEDDLQAITRQIKVLEKRMDALQQALNPEPPKKAPAPPADKAPAPPADKAPAPPADKTAGG